MAVRQHAGLMVPGPAQAAGVAALADEDHVEAQRERYRERLAFLAGVLGGYGCPVALPEGGFYLWVPVPTGRWRDAWVMAEALATDGGLLVSPGDLYGEERGRARPGGGGPADGTAWRWWGSASHSPAEHQAARCRGKRPTAARMAAMAGSASSALR